MFHFGDEKSAVQVFWDSAKSKAGPKVPDCPLDEMSIMDLRNIIAYARMAYQEAVNLEASENVIEALLKEHDEIFYYLAQVDDEFRKRVFGEIPSHINWLGGYDPDNIAKYKLLASGVSLEEIYQESQSAN